MGELKLATLNIEGDRHLPSVKNFLADERPDVACLQETNLADLKPLAGELNYVYQFAPTVSVDRVNQNQLTPKGRRGVAILTSTQPVSANSSYYVGLRDKIPVYEDDYLGLNKVLLSVDVQKEGLTFRIATTHLTWAPDGQPSPVQDADLGQLLELINRLGECVFCGDFNAPRGNGVWERIAAKFKDNVPSEIDSTLDPVLHRTKGAKKYVVDGIFSTASYTVSGVKAVGAVSDHKALVGYVSHLREVEAFVAG